MSNITPEQFIAWLEGYADAHLSVLCNETLFTDAWPDIAAKIADMRAKSPAPQVSYRSDVVDTDNGWLTKEGSESLRRMHDNDGT